MNLQKNKCAFCERQFEDHLFGTIEFDLEHFRPKSSAVVWPDPVRHPELAYDFPTGAAQELGYFWLAYELANYAASCKVCNTTFKLNYFPIGGPRGTVAAPVAGLRNSEGPYLCYPIGTIDDDPEDLVTFTATTAIPAARTGNRHRRGRIIIDFFGLNEREQLHRGRAQMISLFGPALAAVSQGRDSPSDRQLIARMGSPALPHASCLRAFQRLWRSDEPTARRIVDLCREFAVSDAGTLPPDP
jgi:hypothetical protein